MNDDVDIKVEHIAKKYCKSLRRSMSYGIRDIGRNTFGLSAHPGTLRSDEFWAVDDVSFEVRRGETLGLIGPNGSGKTTILKMLNGIFWPDKGKITVNGRVGALIAVGAGFHPALTGRENVYVNAAILGMNKKEATAKFDDIVEFAEIGEFIDTPVKFYSSGMYVRLGFAVAIHCDLDILLVDEVLAVGDAGFRNKCLRRIGELREGGMTTVLVSHSMNLITVYTDRAILMNHGKATEYDNPSEAAREYASLFVSKDGSSVEKICSGTQNIRFFDIWYTGGPLVPGDSFLISMRYESKVDYPDVAVDTKILSGEGAYFQATNKAYGQTVNLYRGEHSLRIEVKGITLNNAAATVAIAIWTKYAKDPIFWWRIPVEFKGVTYATGSNFLEVCYRTETDD